MTDWIEAWQCAGCGKIEAPQPCIGVCRDRKILMVGKDEHERVLDAARDLQRQVQTAHTLLSHLAWSVPREGQWELSYRALQTRARELLNMLAPIDIQPVDD